MAQCVREVEIGSTDGILWGMIFKNSLFLFLALAVSGFSALGQQGDREGHVMTPPPIGEGSDGDRAGAPTVRDGEGP